MAIEPQLLFGKVMHQRLFPKRNGFCYGMYYLVLPLSKMAHLPIACNRFAPLAFYTRDHGHADGRNLSEWAQQILEKYGLDQQANGEIVLVCMPRVLGYVFNPVSFWFCHDTKGNLRAVLCEVNNTFGERHTYLCAHKNHRRILPEDIVIAKKIFHVSPFLEREGHYEFRFDSREDRLCVHIDFFNGEGKKTLITALQGQNTLMNTQALRKAFWGYPLVTFKAILLIHWQALKLLIKKIKYIPKPAQLAQPISASDGLRKQ